MREGRYYAIKTTADGRKVLVLEFVDYDGNRFGRSEDEISQKVEDAVAESLERGKFQFSEDLLTEASK